ncbi:MAG TPA: hypothetical protein VMA71_00255 [Alloacidobacterium sp.]|nr:hypothetical protein [Alloacidobacterium sp.]
MNVTTESVNFENVNAGHTYWICSVAKVASNSRDKATLENQSVTGNQLTIQPTGF